MGWLAAIMSHHVTDLLPDSSTLEHDSDNVMVSLLICDPNQLVPLKGIQMYLGYKAFVPPEKLGQEEEKVVNSC